MAANNVPDEVKIVGNVPIFPPENDPDDMLAEGNDYDPDDLGWIGHLCMAWWHVRHFFTQ